MTTTRRRWALVAALVAVAAGFAAYAAVLPTKARTAEPGTVQDDFELMQMVHTTEPATNPAAGPPIPSDGDSPGLYRYNSRDCRENAPVNNISTNLVSYNSRYGRSPASTRSQPFEIQVVHGDSAEESRLQGRSPSSCARSPRTRDLPSTPSPTRPGTRSSSSSPRPQRRTRGRRCTTRGRSASWAAPACTRT